MELVPVSKNVPSHIQALVPGSSLSDTVESSLSAAIVSGELAPGTLVSVPRLASRFGVSATPVREAVLRLEKRGFVTAVRNKGFLVTDVSEHDLHDLVQIRQWLEAPAMQIAAEKLHGKPAKELRGFAEAVTRGAEDRDFHAFLTADAKLHLAILRLTGNDRLVELVTELRKQTRLIGLVSLTNSAELAQSAQEHHALLDLLTAGKRAEAEALMFTHIGHAVDWWAGH
jgi:DNA-binding GntR family transcriptional regulator